MSWDDIYKDMAFSPYKTEIADQHKVNDALVTLECYLQGQSRNYEVLDALFFLEERFGVELKFHSDNLKTQLVNIDEDTRMPICFECIQKIACIIRKKGGAWKVVE